MPHHSDSKGKRKRAPSYTSSSEDEQSAEPHPSSSGKAKLSKAIKVDKSSGSSSLPQKRNAKTSASKDLILPKKKKVVRTSTPIASSSSGAIVADPEPVKLTFEERVTMARRKPIEFTNWESKTLKNTPEKRAWVQLRLWPTLPQIRPKATLHFRDLELDEIARTDTSADPSYEAGKDVDSPMTNNTSLASDGDLMVYGCLAHYMELVHRHFPHLHLGPKDSLSSHKKAFVRKATCNNMTMTTFTFALQWNRLVILPPGAQLAFKEWHKWGTLFEARIAAYVKAYPLRDRARIIERDVQPLLNELWDGVMPAWVQWLKDVEDTHRRVIGLSEDKSKVITAQSLSQYFGVCQGADNELNNEARAADRTLTFEETEYDTDGGKLWEYTAKISGVVVGRGAATNAEKARLFASYNAKKGLQAKMDKMKPEKVA